MASEALYRQCIRCSPRLRSFALQGPRLTRDVQPLRSSARLGGTRRHNSTNADEEPQHKSLEGYYEELLNNPLRQYGNPSRPPPKAAATAATTPLPKTSEEEKIARARVIFGSRLAGPAQRRRELEQKSRRVAGVLVPPKPDEPDNCCMSGCVNCVWDRYRDEIEEWAEKSAQARERLMAQRREEGKGTEGTAKMPANVASSMDDDGGGSEGLWTEVDPTGVGGKADLFADVPVGIREFMRTEKKLKERKKQREERLAEAD